MSDGNTAGLEELLQFIYLTPVGTVKFGPDGTIDLINPMAAQLLLPIAPSADLANFYDSIFPLIPELRQLVTDFTPSAGSILDKRRLEMGVGRTSNVISLSVQRISRFVYMAVLDDVTNNVRQEQKLAADHQRFRAIVENIREYAIYTITLQGLIEEWNPSLQRFGGWVPADLKGHTIENFFPNNGSPDSNAFVLLKNAQDLGSFEAEGWLLKRDGERLWCNVIITALPDKTGTTQAFVVVARDMTERKRMEDDLQQLATLDPLTGALNRRQGHALLTTEFQRRARFGQTFAVLMVDIDWFKSINDRYGHAAGDSVLCATVVTCKSTLRGLDALVRWGGEEFLVILPGATADGALVTAERLREAIADMRVPVGDDHRISLTVSIGAAVALDNDASGLLRRADEALYAAKARGRNQTALTGS